MVIENGSLMVIKNLSGIGHLLPASRLSVDRGTACTVQTAAPGAPPRLRYTRPATPYVKLNDKPRQADYEAGLLQHLGSGRPQLTLPAKT